jgi:arginyl-tRNA synthetase
MEAERLRGELARVLRELGVEAPGDIVLERPRNPEHGDLATNVAMTLAKPLRMAPRQIAEEISARVDLERAGLRSLEVAGPGFINFRIQPQALLDGLLTIIEEGDGYGRNEDGAGRPVMIEFVSANPTGPLHIGHGRQAALGDAIAELLAWNGWDVHREFYYNDAGEQIARLTRSVWTRYQQHLGQDVHVPEDGYHGSYVLEIAQAFAGIHGDQFRDDPSEPALDEVRRFAVRILREEQNRDLDEFRVRFDHFYLESSLYAEGRVAETIARLRETGLAYEKDGALWLETTRFGDDKDRVMVKSTGHPTYFLPDVAYHVTKWERGFERVINVQGADHHGTVARVRAGLKALGYPTGYPEYVLHQMVLVFREGVEVKFSKRAGDYVTLRDLFDEVTVDVTRYFFLMRRSEAQLTFDMDLALDQSDKNPVFKVQYAHARMSSIFRKAGIEDASTVDATGADLALLSHPSEIELAKVLTRFAEIVRTAADRQAPHLVCDYLEDLAGSVNSWYHAGNLDHSLRVIGVPEPVSRARLLLARAVQIVLRNGLSILGVSAPTRMDREIVAEA